MAQKIGIIAYNLARELLVKDKGGIATLPQNKEVLGKVQDIFDMLKAGGYNPISAEKAIKNTKDLKRVLTDVEMKLTMDKDLRRSQSEGIEEVMKKMEEGIPLNPGDQAKMRGVEELPDDEVLDAFKGFTPRVIQGGKSEGIEQLLKSGDVKKGVAPKTTKETIERKSMIDPKLTEEENIKNIMAENKAAAKRLEQKMNPEKDLGDRLKDFDGDPDAMAEGGLMRLGMFAGGVPFRRLLQFLNQQTGRTGSEGLNKLKLPDQIKFFAEKQGFNPDQNRIEYVEQVLDALKADRKLIRSLESDAPSAVTGKAKDKMELIADKMFTENFLGDTQKGRFKGMTSKDYDKSILEVETILKNLKPEGRKPNAEGGIAMLAEGGPENKGRRNFLKLMGGLAALPVVGKFFKPAAKVVDKAGPAVTEGVKLGFDKFMMLVDKIKRLGRKTDGVTQNAREEGYVYIGKDGNAYELVEDIATGDVRVTKDKVGVGSYNDKTFDTIEDRSTFVLRRNQADETTKGKKPPDEYDEMKEVPGPDGTFDDIDEVSDTAVEEVLEELGETRIKKAGGGLAYMLGE